jgi:hypothetical protein
LFIDPSRASKTLAEVGEHLVGDVDAERLNAFVELAVFS